MRPIAGCQMLSGIAIQKVEVERLLSQPANRVSPLFFKNKTCWSFTISVGRMKEEDEFLKTYCFRDNWARTRYEDHVVYLFADQEDAMYFKMGFK